MISRSLLIVFLFLSIAFFLDAQPKLGLPKISNYSKDDFKAATMNWALVRGLRGKVYFGNSYGLMAYDGNQWDVVLEPDNRTDIFSLAIDFENTIYIGAEGDMGYTIRNSIGQINYKSINPLIPKAYGKYGLVWNIILLDTDIYYFTDYNIYIYDGSEVKVHSFDKQIIFSQKLNGEIYLQQKGDKLMKLKHDGSIEPVLHTDFVNEFEVRFLTYRSGELILITREGRIWKVSKEEARELDKLSQFIKNVRINKGIDLSSGEIALATVKDGVMVLDMDGHLTLHVNKDNGLIDNTVIDILEDDQNNLWLTLGNGISYVEFGCDFYYLDDRSNLVGSVYSTAFYNDHLYVATNQGVYSRSMKGIQEPFEFIPATESHTWNLTIKDDQFLLGNHDGAFEIKGNKIIPINTNQDGAWQFINVPGNENLLLQGSYKGIFILKRENGLWTVSHKLEGFDETAREMILDPDGNLWVGHGYNGIYKLKLSSDYQKIEEVELFDTSRGLPSNNWNNLFLIRDKLLFGTVHGIYKYDEVNNEMMPHPHYQNLLGENQLVRRLVETPNGDIFFIKGLDNEDEMGMVIEGSSNSSEIRQTPFQKLKGELIPAFESISFYENQMFIGSKDGLIVYKPGETKKETFYTNIRSVFCSNANDSIIYGHPKEYDPFEFGEDFHQELPYDLNAVKISYSASFFERTESIVYRTYLEGYEEDWTGWTSSLDREFTNLKEGEYTFFVESKNVFGNIGEMDSFHFKVLPPWYRSLTMKIIYLLFFMMSCIALWFIRRYKLRLSKLKHLKEIRQQRGELVRQNQLTEQKMIQLQMEKLKAEVEFKNRELASSTLRNANQNESILRVLNQIEDIDTVKDPQARNQLERVSKLLKEMIDEERNWDQFEQHFNELHDDFIKRIKQTYPKLTSRDIRLCAYLRMNLASKEIAPLMGISYRGVEALRYRIRKKLNLENSDNLVDYILEF